MVSSFALCIILLSLVLVPQTIAALSLRKLVKLDRAFRLAFVAIAWLAGVVAGFVSMIGVSIATSDVRTCVPVMVAAPHVSIGSGVVNTFIAGILQLFAAGMHAWTAKRTA